MKGLLLHKLHFIKKWASFLLLWGIVLSVGTVLLANEQGTDFFSWATTFPMTFTLSFIAVTVRHQEKVCGWDQFSLTLPVSRKMVVQADYILQCGITVVGCFFAYFQVILLNILHFYPDYDQVLFTFVILTVSQSAMYDLNFMFGMDKSNSFFFIPLILAGIIYFFAPNLTILVLMATNYFPQLFINGSRFLVAVLITYAFYRTALKRMDKMEF